MLPQLRPHFLCAPPILADAKQSRSIAPSLATSR
jgi:hypothetical protein